MTSEIKKILREKFGDIQVHTKMIGNAEQILCDGELLGYIFYDDNGPYFRGKGMKKN